MTTISSRTTSIINSTAKKKNYLTTLNLLNAILWFIILSRTIKINLKHLSFSSNESAPPSAYTSVYTSVGQFTKWTQTLILLDVVHTLTGLVRTSLVTVLFQAGSRLLLVWVVAEKFVVPRQSVWYSLMLFSWAVAEVTRYLYHVYVVAVAGSGEGNGGRGVVPAWLVWARYNFFYVLYITGAGSEWMCMFKSIPEAKEMGPVYYWVLLACLVIWPLGFPNQYLHMIAQRRKMMRGKKKQR